MKTNLLLLVAMVAASVILPAAIQAAELRIEIGDRPFYNHGPRYWAGDYEMIWVPGHWSEHRHHWVHGHYVKGERRHHDEHHHDHDDDRR